ncbi:MAG: hypothetical protein WED34_19790 [Planctomycetales bacterium]
MHLSVSHAFLPKKPSVAASVVMDHFGIGFETGRHVIAEDFELPVGPGDVVVFTGESGSGKSSLMRAAAAQLEDVFDIDSLSLDVAHSPPSLSGRGRGRVGGFDPPSENPRPTPPGKGGGSPPILVDALGLPPEEAMALLSRCGLGEARLMLRTPAELSDGQRYRFRLARALARKPRWIVADEFTATLDRPLARIVSANIRRTADRTGGGFLLATTHEDILADLRPDLHVRCALDGRIACERLAATRSRAAQPRAQGSAPDTRKKTPCSSTNSGSPPVPSPTGRTSLGGITAATSSGWCGS